MRLWTRSAYDSILLLFWQPLKTQFQWALPIFSAIRALCSKTIDSMICSVLGGVFRKCLSVANLTYLVQHIQWSLFCNDAPWPTEQEMKMREELALRITLEFFQNNIPQHARRLIGRDDIKTLISRIIDVLQYPRLNKQLLYVLVDRLLLQIFPELDEFGQHPLQQAPVGRHCTLYLFFLFFENIFLFSNFLCAIYQSKKPNIPAVSPDHFFYSVSSL